MARVVRNRTRSATKTGSAKLYTNETGTGSFSTQVVTSTLTSNCIDYRGSPVIDSNFVSDQHAGWMILSGSFLAMPYRRKIEFEQFPFFGTPEGSVDRTPLASPPGWVLSVVAGTNPSRPKVVPLMWVQNLVQLPRMILNLRNYFKRPRNRTSVQNASSNYLGFQFGWKPLVEDIMVLLDLQSSILKRTKELNQLYSSPRGLRRRLRMGSDTKTYKAMYTYNGFYPSKASIPVTINVHKESWATIRWFPTSPPPYQSDDESKNRFVRRLVLGITSEGTAKGIWDIIPWTWMIGWFTNIGKYTLAHSNTVPASHSGACFMSKVTETWSPGSPIMTSSLGAPGVGGQYVRTQRTRSVSGVVTPGFNLPFLDGFRLSILGALAGQRLGRRQ